MPRGRGKQGKAYSNRTDLNGPVKMDAPTGQPYGERKAQMDAQRAVPMGTPEVPTPSLEAMAPSMVQPRVTRLTEPTQRPNEDLMTVPAATQQADPDVIVLRNEFLPLFRQQAQMPDAPQQFRAFVRWLEGL